MAKPPLNAFDGQSSPANGCRKTSKSGMFLAQATNLYTKSMIVAIFVREPQRKPTFWQSEDIAVILDLYDMLNIVWRLYPRCKSSQGRE